MLCNKCKQSLIEKRWRVFKCNQCDVLFCKECKDDHEHKTRKYKEVDDGGEEEEGEGNENPNEEEKGDIGNWLNEFYGLDCDDVLAGGEILTKFKVSFRWI